MQVWTRKGACDVLFGGRDWQPLLKTAELCFLNLKSEMGHWTYFMKDSTCFQIISVYSRIVNISAFRNRYQWCIISFRMGRSFSGNLSIIADYSTGVSIGNSTLVCFMWSLKVFLQCAHMIVSCEHWPVHIYYTYLTCRHHTWSAEWLTASRWKWGVLWEYLIFVEVVRRLGILRIRS